MESPEPTPPVSTTRSSPLASAALVVALASFICLWGVGGVAAVLLGFFARSEIRSSHGRLRGGRLAGAALALGSLNVVLSAGTLLLLAPRWLQPQPDAGVASVAPPAFTAPPPAEPPPVAEPLGHFSEDTLVRTVRIGQLVLIDVGPEVHSLGAELTRQRALAREHHGAVLVWVVAPHCGPCNGVSAALADPLMQKALRDARLVRIDRSRFAPELAQLGIPHRVIPGFALINQQNRPLDYIHGGEWDEDIAPNIAPVLGEFVRGTYKARREPWRGIKRRDETAL